MKKIKILNPIENEYEELINKRYLKSLFQLLIIGYLVYQISQIGLEDFLESIPLNPLFYIIFISIN